MGDDADDPEVLDLVTLGETLVCLTAEGRLTATDRLRKSIGGAESNTAVGLARLGRSVAWISRLGGDPFGDQVLRTLRGEDVDTSAVTRTDDAPTGLMVKERRSADAIHVHYYRSGSAAAGLTEADVPEELVARARRLHVTGITLALGPGPAAAVHKAVSICKINAVPVSFDPNLRWKLWAPDLARSACEGLFGAVDELLLNEQEALALTGAPDLDGALERLGTFGFAAIVVKRGAAGALGVRGRERVARPARAQGPVVDTVGAGDAFNAGFLHALLDGRPFEVALDWGNLLAGHVVAHPGDYEGLPDRREFEAQVGSRVGPQR